jgi:hypothetical protein
MKKAKEFDCVRMKDEIQARLARQWRGLTDEEIRERIQRKLATSKSPIAQLWRKLLARDEKAAKAEGVRRSGRRSRRVRSPA